MEITESAPSLRMIPTLLGRIFKEMLFESKEVKVDCYTF